MGMMLAEVVMTAREWTAAAVLGGLLGLALESSLRLLRSGGPAARSVLRLLVGLAAFFALAAYGLLAAPWLHSVSALLVAAAALLLTAAPMILRAARGAPVQDGALGIVLHSILLGGLLIVAGATLLTSGFLNLTEDRPILLVEVTGETGTRVVRWAPPDGDVRVESLTTHRVLFRRPEGEVVAEAWVYGDEVAVKGRVLRLSPALNAFGVPNLFELSFAHNGYTSVERHNTMPHQGIPLPRLGSLSVQPLWRPLQLRILSAWQRRADPSGTWGIRAVTVESTYFPLEDEGQKPLSRTFRLVLTAGGLSAS